VDLKKQYRTGDQNWVRERNVAIVLNYLWEAGQPISRADLTKISGLNKSTVGSLLAQLQSWGLVKESGISNQRPGRPGVLIDINPDAGRIIGAEIGVGFITVIVADMKAKVLWRRNTETTAAGKRLTELSQAEVLEQAEHLLQEAITEATTCDCRLYGIGLGVPGLVNHATGTLLFAPNLDWRNVPLRDMWHQRFGVPVVVENEANAAALGEHMLGVAKQLDSFVYLSAGVGLGGGLVIDGQLYGGTGGYAGEVGHMTLEPEGPQCNCGNRGCWEMLVGPRAILQRVRQAATEGRECNPDGTRAASRSSGPTGGGDRAGGGGTLPRHRHRESHQRAESQDDRTGWRP
jgi:predicted NBD/HSP70 family sugar kinase